MTTPHTTPTMWENTKAVLIFFLGMSLAAVMDVIAKTLMAIYTPTFVNWGRFVGNALVLLPFMLLALRRHPARPLKWLIVRGIFLGLASFAFFSSIQHNPIPDALALFFVMPLFVSTFAPVIMKEPFSPASLIACLIGAVGMLILLRPGTGSYHISILYAPTSGILFGLYLMVTRRSTQHTTVLATAFYTSVFAAIALTPFSIAELPSFDSAHLFYLFGVGAFSAAGHYFITLAHKYANAGFLAPFSYGELVAAILISFFVFSYLPDFYATIGLVIIAASGIYALVYPRLKK